eukprot:Nk52_evm40s2152 gene=Nk52_evmTU40s2152
MSMKLRLNAVLAFVAVIVLVFTCVDAFNSIEHKAIGDSVKLFFKEDPSDPKSKTIVHNAHEYHLHRVAFNDNDFEDEKGELKYTYGDIVAIPDFTGVPLTYIASAKQGKDILHRVQRYFMTFYQQTYNLDANEFGRDYHKFVMDDVIPQQKTYVWDAIHKGEDPAKNWPDRTGDLNKKTGGSSFWPYPKQGEYLKLETYNIDHIGPAAHTAWRAFHLYAKLTAIEAAKAGDTKMLERAYMINAYGDHYLSDLFSSGHTRVPRLKLFEVLGPLCGGEFTLLEHDHECQIGLWGKNEMGKEWRVYGDAQFFTKKNEENARIANETIAMSAKGIFDAYVATLEGKTIDDEEFYKPLKYVPNADIFENYSPLFKIDKNNNLAMRTPLNNLYSNRYRTINKQSFLKCAATYFIDELRYKPVYKGNRCDNDHPCSNGNPCKYQGNYGTCGV